MRFLVMFEFDAGLGQQAIDDRRHGGYIAQARNLPRLHVLGDFASVLDVFVSSTPSTVIVHRPSTSCGGAETMKTVVGGPTPTMMSFPSNFLSGASMEVCTLPRTRR